MHRFKKRKHVNIMELDFDMLRDMMRVIEVETDRIRRFSPDGIYKLIGKDYDKRAFMYHWNYICNNGLVEHPRKSHSNRIIIDITQKGRNFRASIDNPQFFEVVKQSIRKEGLPLTASIVIQEAIKLLAEKL